MENQAYDLLIDGTRRQAASTLAVENPATGETVGRVAKGDAADAAAAIDAAAAAAPAWAESAPGEREAPLHAVADAIEADDELATLLAAEAGKPLATAEGEVAETAAQFRFYAGVTDKVRGDTIPTATNRFAYTKRSPYGVTAHVVPWNYPLLLGTRGFASALATGNTLVVKPPSNAPLSTMRVGEMLDDAFPDGVVNVVPGPGSEVGAELAGSAGVDAITFTGSTGVGRGVLEAAAEHITPVDVELGGKAPAIVLPDADVENAARGVVAGIFSNAGQNCVATSRCLVHEDIHDELVDRVVEKTRRITLGEGTDPETDMGPVISEDAQAEVLDYIDSARDEGATLLTGGEVPDDPALADGHFVEPTVFDDVTPDMTIACEEIFGPVLGFVTVSSAEEAIEVANDSPFALAASLWTESIDATRIADRLDHGLVAVNTFPVSMPQSPWGGNKESGIGREGGLEGVEAFTTVDSVVVEHDDIGEPYE
ncbi:aldehyde dehydrogenase (NAD+) [Haloplanus vescus]|uniref:Aldehyde dehydrogenase (NAD+) n=1 Tax=Haloplanus vescus TaxID=555874 RepID=A0A1H3Z9H0_9EURY|nr:aldehyde dehydrogenase family protein [Haloplanus vescus]SEA20178.1 aldehyde dehydrogenase (NAD+) [Haloplanus vescus]